MGPMGPMMGGAAWGSGAGVWPWVVLLTLAVLVIGLLALAAWHSRTPAERRARSPEEVLRDRYARGEITQRQYREVLVDVLKDRYVRGELEIEEYEARLSSLLGPERPREASELTPGRTREAPHAMSVAEGGGRG